MLTTRRLISTRNQRYTRHPHGANSPSILFDLNTQKPAYLYLPQPALAKLNTAQTAPLRIKLYPDRPIHQTLLQLSNELSSTATSSAPLDFHVYSTECDHIVQQCRSNLTSDIVQFALQNCSCPNLNLATANVDLSINLPTFFDRTIHLFNDLDVLIPKLNHLNRVKTEIDVRAKTTADRLVWGGLAFLCAQWGLMARLTWWEYSWDVMEPISYFLTFGTGIVGYMFFVITRREYSFETQTGLVMDIHARSLYAKHGLDSIKYLELISQIKSVTETINQVADEYNLPHLPTKL